MTHSHLSPPLPDSTPLVEQLARVFDETGSFPSTKQSLEFVRIVALERIESMIRIAQRLEDGDRHDAQHRRAVSECLRKKRTKS